MHKQQAYINVFKGLILVLIEFHYKLPKSIPIQIDLINDFLGAIIYLRSVSWLANHVDESFNSWKTLGYLLVIWGVVDFIRIDAITYFSFCPNALAVVAWFLFIHKIIGLEAEKLHDAGRLRAQIGISAICWLAGLFLFLMPRFTPFFTFGSMPAFLLFVLVVNLIYSIPYFRIKNILQKETLS